jgi:hypothetical protein
MNESKEHNPPDCVQLYWCKTYSGAIHISTHPGEWNGVRLQGPIMYVNASAVAIASESSINWEDKTDSWTDLIKAAFPTRSGSHESYAMAMRMVSNRHSKGELIALVNWLLVRTFSPLPKFAE